MAAPGHLNTSRMDFTMPYKDKDKERAAKRKYDKEKREVRGQNWSIIGYPDSLPTDWLERLAEMQIEILVSPLHEADLNATGEEKKPHFHILLMFDSLKSLSQVKEISEMLNAPVPKKMDSKRGAARYLCHLDNPEKAQYPVEDVVCLGGADYLSEISRGGDKYRIIAEIIEFVDDHEIYSYSKLLRIAQERNQEWFRAMCDNIGWTIKEYCKSARYDAIDEGRYYVNRGTEQ